MDPGEVPVLVQNPSAPHARGAEAEKVEKARVEAEKVKAKEIQRQKEIEAEKVKAQEKEKAKKKFVLFSSLSTYKSIAKNS